MSKRDDEVGLHLITPRSLYVYPRLGPVADKGTKKFPQKPNFNVKGVFKPGQQWVVGKQLVDHDAVVEKLEEMRDAEFDRQLAEAKAKKNGKLVKQLHKADVLRAEVNEEGVETGELSVRAKTAAQYEDKETKKIVLKDPPTMFDAKGKKIGKLPPVGGGSEGKIGVYAKPYFLASSGAVGITFYLEATQLLKLVKYTGGRSADAMGFGAEEGYTDDGDGEDGFVDETGGDEPATGGTTSGGSDDF
jgi:hypothetical protein